MWNGITVLTFECVYLGSSLRYFACSHIRCPSCLAMDSVPVDSCVLGAEAQSPTNVLYWTKAAGFN